MANPATYQSNGIEADKLRSLAEDLQNLAAALFPAPDPLDPGDAASDLSLYTRVDPDDRLDLVELARRAYRSRRLRSDVFKGDQLFGEPAWDMLLDLFIAEADHRPLSITAACIGAAVPTSTALRWLMVLEERGLVRRENDPSDARRVFIHLTSEGYTKMIAYFRSLQREAVTDC